VSIPADQSLVAEIGLAAFAGKVPEHLRDKLEIRYRREGQSFILFEWRPRFGAPEEWQDTPVAKFTYVQKTAVWKLLRMDRNLRWRRYEPLPESRELSTLFEEVENDPWCFFWG
jgi:hypothetical protein